MPMAGLEPAVPTSEQPQTCALDRTDTGLRYTINFIHCCLLVVLYDKLFIISNVFLSVQYFCFIGIHYIILRKNNKSYIFIIMIIVFVRNSKI